MLFGHIKNIISFKALKPVHWLLLLLGFFIIHIPAILNDPGNTNAYLLLAKSLVHGKISLSPGDMHYFKDSQVLDTGDLIFYFGKYYLPYPPFPAILMIPFLLTGSGTVNSVLIAVLLSCLNICLLHKIITQLGIRASLIPWLIYGFFFGTSYWYALLSAHHVYGFAQIVAVTSCLLLLYELLGRKRAFLLGIFLGFAFLSRQFTVFISLFVLGYLFYYYMLQPPYRDKKTFLKKAVVFILSLSIFVFLYFIYNYIRFGDPLDTGYKYIIFIGVLKARVNEYGVFNIHYVLYNLYNYLIKGFNIEFTGKDLLQIKDVDLFGTALFIASPFLISCFKTGWSRFPRIIAWITVGIIFTGLLFYHNNGKDQVNASRFTLDFLPILYILTALGAKNIPGWLFKGLIIYAIALNIVAISVHFLYHTL